MALKLQFIAHRRKTDGVTQDLLEHLKGVSDLAGQFAEKVGLKESGKLIGLLHDIGKASKEFDQYIRSAVGLIDPDQDDYFDASGKKRQVDNSTACAKSIDKHIKSKIIMNISLPMNIYLSIKGEEVRQEYGKQIDNVKCQKGKSVDREVK